MGKGPRRPRGMRAIGRRMYDLAAGVGAQKNLHWKPSLQRNNSATVKDTKMFVCNQLL
jgi:hypothetical protein